MDLQEQIDHVKAALTAVNSAISQTQAALQNASTIDDMQALQNTLVDLQAQRSQLETTLINLQAAQTQVEPISRQTTNASAIGTLNLNEERLSEIGNLKSSLTASVVDRTVTKAILTHAGKVGKDAARLHSILKSGPVASPGQQSRKAKRG